MAVGFVKSHTITAEKTLDTSATLTLASSVPAGNLLVVPVLFDNAGVASKPVVSSIARQAGETATWVSLGAARSTSTSIGAQSSGELWAIKTTVAWSATTYAVTLDTAVTMKAVNALEFTGAEAALRSTSGSGHSATSTAATATTTGTTPVIGDLAVGFMFQSNSSTNLSADTDTLGGAWSSQVGVGSSGGGGTTNNFGNLQYKVLTAASHQTFNSAGTPAAGNGSIVAILQATIDPLVTQAAYRFYADGTETGSTALAGQDTAPTVDTSSGDVNLGLRVRLQETAGGVVPATDDFQLQWEKNTSGTWKGVEPAGLVIDRYDVSQSSGVTLIHAGVPASAQSFYGDGRVLAAVDFYLSTSNSPTGTVSAVLYAHDGGTFGSTGRPTGSPLATSTTTVTASTIPTTRTTYTFAFDGTFTLAAGTPYFIALSGTGLAASPNLVRVDKRAPTPTHAGNEADSDSIGSWTAVATADLCFEVRTLTAGTTVVTYASPNLTNQGATTSRLTGGSGTFVAGKVSEDGLADDLGWSASNHTELLYALTLKQADLAPSDTLRFRVLKNGATTGLTYTQVPTVTIGAGGPATIQATAALVATSTLTATAVPERAATVTLTAASTLSTAGVPAREAAAALTAVSTLTATGTVAAPAPEIAATAALTAASALSATGVRIPQATASLVAASTLTATGTRFGVPLATVALAGVSTLTATAVREPQAVASLTATSTLTATAVRSPQPTVALVAASTLTVTATRFGVLLATVPLTATGTLTATAVREPQATASLTATSTLTATGIRTQDATAALVGASELTTGAVVARVPTVPLSAVSVLTATATTAAAPVVTATVAMSAASTLTTTAVREPQATVSLVAGSTLTATAVRVIPATAALTAVSTLTASAITFGATGGAAVLTAASTLTPTAFRVLQATVSLTATSTLTATAGTTGATFATAALTASSTLTATAVRQPQATVSLTATAVLTVTGVRVRVVAVALTATSTLTATPTRVRPATVPLTAAATLTVQLVRIPQAFVGMTATSVLVATATVTLATVGIPNAAHTGFLHALDTDMTWYPVTVPT